MANNVQWNQLYFFLYLSFFQHKVERSKLSSWKHAAHRVGRVLSFSPVVGIGTPPSPHPQARIPPTLWFRGHTLWRDRGWESPNSDEGTYTVVLCQYMYFVMQLYTVYSLHCVQWAALKAVYTKVTLVPLSSWYCEMRLTALSACSASLFTERPRFRCSL